MKIKGRSLPRTFLFIWVILFFGILFLTMMNVQEVEVPGWEFNVSRNLNHYLNKDALTATLYPKDFCDKSVFLVIICISSPTGFEARKTIRETWGRDQAVMGHNVSLYFLLGQTTDLDVQSNITDESLQYRDLIQENFIDSYNNLTLKSATMLKLFVQKCKSTASYLLKIDNDIFLNLPQLVNDLVMRNQSKGLLMGHTICRSKPIRTIGDKWYAGPSYMYPYDIYPTYISGTSYCMSSDAAESLFNTALTTPIFHLEDVYLTGICAKKAGLHLTHNGRFTFHYLKPDYCLYRQLIAVHYQDPNSIRTIHESSQQLDVDKKCDEDKEVFLVHRWLIDNVFMVDKARRRGKNRCV